MVWCLWQARSRYSLILLALFGILETASESPDREQGLGSIDCPHSLTVHWNNTPARPPYVENSTGDFDGLLPSNVFGIFYAFPVRFLSILSVLFFLFLFTNCLLKGCFVHLSMSILCKLVSLYCFGKSQSGTNRFSNCTNSALYELVPDLKRGGI